MVPTDSNLSNSKYGYDFVVSTTQASINSDLLAFLNEDKQPTEYICFLADRQTGNPNKQVTLEELLKLTGGVNPFDIPHGTSYDDPRMKPLTEALFVVGIKIRMGLPVDVAPIDLPPVVTLGSGANNVTFNLFCSHLSVIQNSPPSGFGGKGQWNVWSQPSDNPWYVETRVDLVAAHLDNELNTPYLNNHPKIKAQLRNQLMNISSSAFSLTQLIFDLDTAAVESLPTFRGVPHGSNAETILQKSFVSIYSASAKSHGLPLVSVMAIPHTPDPSQLQLTSFERQVSQLKDEKGAVISDPTKLQQSATTLDHLCAVNNHPLPGAASFSWNWVLPKTIHDESGVIAINRNAIANQIKDQLLQLVRGSCISASCHVKAYALGEVVVTHGFSAGEMPQIAEVTSNGAKVIHIEHSSNAVAKDKAGATYGAAQIKPTYTCDVSFVDDNVIVQQRLIIYVYFQWDDTHNSANVVDKTITDTYTVSVDQLGKLKMTKTKEKTTDDGKDPDLGWLSNLFTGVADMIKDIKKQAQNVTYAILHDLPFTHIQNFVFPGSRVFTFKSPSFSSYQDLVCNITYLDPGQTPPPAMGAGPPTDVGGATTNRNLSPTYSSDLMQNYVQGEIVSPTGKFEALQTDDGHAILFSVDSSGVFHAITEHNGKTTTGWQLSDLSTIIMKERFSHDTQAAVRAFDVGQSAVNGSISLAMAVRSVGTDHLFVSVQNSNSDTSWTAKPKWIELPFDAVTESHPIMAVEGILFAETTRHEQHLIVDIDRSEKSGVKEIKRYYVDPSMPTGSYWVSHDVPIDIESGNYQSCVGRVSKGRIDGVYTSGKVAGSPQLVYVPIANIFGDGPAAPRRFSLPGGVMPSAIATARSVDHSSSHFATTDLYAVSGSTLYRFAADKQTVDATAKPVVTDNILSMTETLVATMRGGVTTIWGKNHDDQIYYLSCPTAQLSLPGSWSAPVPILTGVERISAFLNRADGGNTVFASGGGKLKKLTQATNTPSKLWRPQEITLASSAKQNPLSFMSYTTTLHVSDENDLPAKGVTVSIMADSRTPVYMNGLYYVLGREPVEVVTDSTGMITVIEATENITAAILTVSVDGNLPHTVINPMDKSFKKLTKLTSEEALRSANVPVNTIAGGVIGPAQSAPLVEPSTMQRNVETVAQSMTTLSNAYSHAKFARGTEQTEAIHNHGVVPMTLYFSSPTVSSVGKDVAIAAGDLFRWLKTGVEAMVDLIWDDAQKAWHFVVTIADKVYRAVLDTVDAVVGAVEWVFNAIKTGIEKLIKFIEFLFEWDDIRRTKDVMHNVVKRYLEDQVEKIPEAKKMFNGQVASVQQSLDTWAHITDWSSLGAPATESATGSTSNPNKGQTSSSQLLAHHFRNNIHDLNIVGGDPPFSIVQQTIDELLSAISQEGKVLETTYTRLKELASKFSSMSIGDAIKAIVAILADGALSSVQVVADALLNVLANVASSAVTILDAKIHIPVISDVLNAIGIPDLSFLDLFSWIAAVSYTVVYKILNNRAPFVHNANTDAIISAKTWDDLASIFQEGASEEYDESSLSGGAAPSSDVKHELFIAGHAIAGFMLITGDFVSVFEANSPTGDNPFSIPSAVVGIIAAAAQGGVDILVPQYAIENKAISGISKALTTAVIASKILFCGPVQKRLKVSKSNFRFLAADDGRATGAVINGFLVLPALFVSGWHFYELSSKPTGAMKSAAVVGEVSNLVSYVSRVSYMVAVNDKDPESREIFIGIMALSNICGGGLQTAESAIHE